MISCCCVCLPLFVKHDYSSDLLFPPYLLGFWDPCGRFLSRLSWKGSSLWPIPTWVGFVHVGNTFPGRIFYPWPYLLRFEYQKLTHPRGGTYVNYYLGKLDCTNCFHLTSIEIFKMPCGCQEFRAHVYVMGCWKMLGPIISPILAAWPPIISELVLCIAAP